MAATPNVEFLTKAIERILANRYGKTVTVRVKDVKSNNQGEKPSERTEANESTEGKGPKGS